MGWSAWQWRPTIWNMGILASMCSVAAPLQRAPTEQMPITIKGIAVSLSLVQTAATPSTRECFLTPNILNWEVVQFYYTTLGDKKNQFRQISNWLPPHSPFYCQVGTTLSFCWYTCSRIWNFHTVDLPWSLCPLWFAGWSEWSVESLPWAQVAGHGQAKSQGFCSMFMVVWRMVNGDIGEQVSFLEFTKTYLDLWSTQN